MAIRFAPLESFPPCSDLLDEAKVKHIVDVIKAQLVRLLNTFQVLYDKMELVFQKILDATVTHRENFRSKVRSSTRLKLVELPGWAGLGAVRFLPSAQDENEESKEQTDEVNMLNIEIIAQLRHTDAAFSKGTFLPVACFR